MIVLGAAGVLVAVISVKNDTTDRVLSLVWRMDDRLAKLETQERPQAPKDDAEVRALRHEVARLQEMMGTVVGQVTRLTNLFVEEKARSEQIASERDRLAAQVAALNRRIDELAVASRDEIAKVHGALSQMSAQLTNEQNQKEQLAAENRKLRQEMAARSEPRSQAVARAPSNDNARGGQQAPSGRTLETISLSRTLIEGLAGRSATESFRTR